MIQILHYVDSTSDKIWAINTNPLAGGNYEVFYGRRTNKLTRREVDIKNPHTRISEQERRGMSVLLDRLIFNQMVFVTSMDLRFNQLRNQQLLLTPYLVKNQRNGLKE